jgi:transposase InsO family protein
MARDGVAVDADLAAAVAAHARGEKVNVAHRARELGVSESTFHKYVARFKEYGVQGLFPDSRRPHSSPTRLPAAWEDVLVSVRKELADQGWDYGADAVLLHLAHHRECWPPGVALVSGGELPSRATVNRVFEARGQLVKVPQRRPRRRYRRFVRLGVNELWQYDGFDYPLLEGPTATVLHLTDDCSRVDLALQAAVSENGADVWATFCLAVARYGLPMAVLNDNGPAFSGRHGGWISLFEQRLADLHVQPICSSIRHPQTCGKNERAHQRVLKWLARQPQQPRDLAALQALLDSYREQFNSRPNQVLDGLSPHQRFDLGPLQRPAEQLDPVTHVTRHRVTTTGSIGLDGHLVGLGRRYATKNATVFRNADHLTVFVEDEFARELIIDRRRRYQPIGSAMS